MTPPPPDLLLIDKQTSSTASISSYMQSANSLLLASTDDDHSACSTPSLSQSEAEYETCDSGVSEQSSLSDEVTSVHRTIPNSNSMSMSINAVKMQTNQMQKQSPPITASTAASSSYSRSPSPTSSQRTFKSTHSTIKSNRSNSITSLNSLQMGSGSQQSHAQSTNESEQTEKTDSTKLPHRSIISDVFDGKLLSSVQCLTCDRVSTREETFQDLSLPIPGKDHLNVLHQSQGFVSPLPTGLSSDSVSRFSHLSNKFNFNKKLIVNMNFLNSCIKELTMVGSGGFGIGFDHSFGVQLSHYTIACQHFSAQMNSKVTICTGMCSK